MKHSTFWKSGGILLPVLLLFCCAGSSPAATPLIPCDLQTEAMTNPVGLDTLSPRFSWKSTASDSKALNLKQDAYRILVSDSPAKLAADQGNIWDSGKVKSEQSLYVEYKGAKLVSSSRYYWKVQLWNGDRESKWSEPASWVTGILKPSDWKAKWIAQSEFLRKNIDLSNAFWIAADGLDCGTKEKPKGTTFYLRREFEVKITADEIAKKSHYALFRYAGNKRFEIYVNNNKAAHSIGMIYNPDQLRTIDVMKYIVPGKNLIAIRVTNNEATPAAFLGRFEFGKLDKSAVPVSDRGPDARGTYERPSLVISTDSKWQTAVKVDKGDAWREMKPVTGWTAAKQLFGPDNGPWGTVRRRLETESPLFEKNFRVKKEVKEAYLHIAGLGFYEASLDGKKIGNRLLDPPPTNFNKTVLYSTYDLTDQLVPGERNLKVMLGHGWYDVRSIVTWNFDAAPWRDWPRLMAQLVIRYKDGTRDTVVTNENWITLSSPVLFDCIRQGEIWDANRPERPIASAQIVDPPLGQLRANALPPTIITEEFKPKSVRETSPGVWLVEIGRNIAGWCRVTLRDTKKGDVVRFRYSERILEDGSIERHEIEMHFLEGSASNLTGEVGKFQTDYYICKGAAKETFEPRFTYNGFTYLEVTGLRAKPTVDDFTACIAHNDFKQIGTFSCDNDLLNKIQAATLLSYRGNFVNGYPTDCPHREKNGWTGDAHLATEQAMYNWSNSAAYEKWIGDLVDEQQPDGNLPGIVPTGGWGYPWGNGPGWDSSLILIPWYLYTYCNDIRILEKTYPAMVKYMGYMSGKATNHLVSHGLGDWVPAKTKTPTVLTSSGYYYVDSMIVAQTAKLLGKRRMRINILHWQNRFAPPIIKSSKRRRAYIPLEVKPLNR